MDKVFYGTTVCGINEALQHALETKLETFMVRAFDHRLSLSEQMTKEEEYDLLGAYRQQRGGERCICRGCSKDCVEYTYVYDPRNGDRYHLCSTCNKADFMKDAISMRGCGFINSPYAGACFDE